MGYVGACPQRCRLPFSQLRLHTQKEREEQRSSVRTVYSLAGLERDGRQKSGRRAWGAPFGEWNKRNGFVAVPLHSPPETNQSVSTSKLNGTPNSQALLAARSFLLFLFTSTHPKQTGKLSIASKLYTNSVWLSLSVSLSSSLSLA